MKKTITLLIIIYFLTAGLVWADGGIVKSHRDAIQTAMSNYIKEISDKNGNGMFPVFDPQLKTIVQLKFEALHDSVEIKGREYPYFISCAYFKDPNGIKYDLDFLMSKKHEVIAVLIHAKNDRKTRYDIH